jgi:hypothetical protein
MEVMNAARTKPFMGAAVNSGTVLQTRQGGRMMLTLSDDFRPPEAPAPHWRLVDAAGNAYLMNRLVVEGGRYNQSIAVPSYVKDVASVQIWCAFAEVLLGEAPFEAPVR